MERSDSSRRHVHCPQGAEAPSYASPQHVDERTAASMRRVDELVGGTLAWQECTSRLKALADRVDGFDEKVLNLTRLVQLAQGLAAEREEELRQENDELRGRLKRQEQTTARLHQELEALKGGLAEQVSALLQPHLDAQRAEHQSAVSALETRLSQTQAALQAVSDEHARQSALAPQYAKDLDETREWVKRNLQRLKQHVDAAHDSIAEVTQHQTVLSSGLHTVECKAEVEYKKLRLLLQKRTKESEALMALLERELVEVHKVAQNHRVLRSSDIDLYVEEEDSSRPQMQQ